MNIGLLNEKPPLIVELFEYIKNKYFTFNGEGFEHVPTGEGSLVSIELIIFGILIGVIIAAFFAVYNKRVLGEFVRTLIREKCDSPESAKTLEELGFDQNAFIRSSLRSGVTLKKVVKCVAEEEYIASCLREAGVTLDANNGEGNEGDEVADASESEGKNAENSSQVEKNLHIAESGTSENFTIVGEKSNICGKNPTEVGENSQNHEDLTDKVEKSDENTSAEGVATSSGESGTSDESSTNSDAEECGESGTNDESDTNDDSDAGSKSNDKVYFPPYEIDLMNDRFYIPAEDVYMADVKFERKGTSWGGILFTAIISIVFVGALIFWLPDILQFLENLLSGLNGN